ncbi:hypothetical protein RHOER0001_1807 [Rhodococcus erythropolis SK121]|nr:hypothetical protein RHOER0001_1807 [Rhodococcus erythropolis SK121]
MLVMRTAATQGNLCFSGEELVWDDAGQLTDNAGASQLP